MLVHHVEAIKEMSDNRQVEPLVKLIDNFMADVTQLRSFVEADSTPEVEAELACIEALHKQQPEAASKEMEELKGDLAHINANVLRTA